MGEGLTEGALGREVTARTGGEASPRNELARRQLPPPLRNEVVARAARSLRLGLLMSLAPRKLGSMEDWIVAMAQHAAVRGHLVDLYCLDPVHPTFAERLREAGASLRKLPELTGRPLSGVRRLAQYDVVQFNFFQVRELVPRLCYAAAGARIVYVDHTSGQPGAVRRPVSSLLDVAVARRLSRVVGVSEYVRARDLARFRTDKVVRVYNGVDVSRFRRVRRPRGPDEPMEILSVAHLIPQKGIDVLLRAVARLPKGAFRLRIAGDGPERGRLEQLVAKLGIADGVELLGLRDDVEALLERAHVFVHPAVWDEAFGLTIAEAMASGLPVVASRTGGIPEIIQDAESGLLFEPGNERALAEALQILMDGPNLCLRLGSNATARAERLFDLATCARRHIEVLEDAAGLPRLGL